MKPLIIVSILLIILIIGSYKYGKRSSEISMLHGFYEANSEFCNEACIKSFTLYIGDYCNGSYNTYLLMIGNEDEKILINSPSAMSLSGGWFTNEDDCYEFNTCFSNLESELIPKNIILKFYTKSGKIILCSHSSKQTDDSATVYGCLFKNCILTEIDIIKNKNNLHFEVNKVQDIA
jgi:hypothetical protein